MKSRKIVIAVLDAIDRKAHCGASLWTAALIVLRLVSPIGAVRQAKYTLASTSTLAESILAETS